MIITITEEEAKTVLPIIEQKRKEAAKAKIVEKLTNEIIKESILYLVKLTNVPTAKQIVRQILKEL